MGSLAENLAPPYYQAVLDETRTALRDAEKGAPADQMVTLATHQPGFLGLETARDDNGRRVTISYWRDIDAIEGWKSAGHSRIRDRFGLGLDDTCAIQVTRIEAPGRLERALAEIFVAARNTETRGLGAFVFAAILSLAGFLP